MILPSRSCHYVPSSFILWYSTVKVVYTLAPTLRKAMKETARISDPASPRYAIKHITLERSTNEQLVQAIVDEIDRQKGMLPMCLVHLVVCYGTYLILVIYLMGYTSDMIFVPCFAILVFYQIYAPERFNPAKLCLYALRRKRLWQQELPRHLSGDALISSRG